MHISINSYQKPQQSFMAMVHAKNSVMKTAHNKCYDSSNATILALKANLKSLKAQIGYEVASSISKAMRGELKISDLANSKVSNAKAAVDECINKIVSNQELQRSPELHATVLEMKADALQDITALLNIIK